MISKYTKLIRETVSQEFRELLPAEPTVGVVRKVQVMIPSSPNVYGILLPDSRFPGAVNAAKAAGYDRTYKGAPLTSGAQIIFHLLPDQSFWVGAEENIAELGVIVEYLEPKS